MHGNPEIDGREPRPRRGDKPQSFTQAVSRQEPALTLANITRVVQQTLGSEEIRINRDPGRTARPAHSPVHRGDIGGTGARSPEYIIAVPASADIGAAKASLVTLGIPNDAIRVISNRGNFYHKISLTEEKMVAALERSSRHWPEAERINAERARQIVDDPAALIETVQKLFARSPEKHHRWTGYEGMVAHKIGDGRVIVDHMPQDASLQAVFQLPEEDFTTEPQLINGLIVEAKRLEEAVSKAMKAPTSRAAGA